MIWARMAFVILFLSPLLPFSGAVHQGFAPLLLSYASRQGRCLLLGGREKQQTHSLHWILCGLSGSRAKSHLRI